MATINIKTKGNLLIISVTGDLTANEAMAVIKENYSNGIIKDVIWDLRLGTLQSITRDGFESIARVTKEALANGSRRGGKTAFIGNSPDEYVFLCLYTTIAKVTAVPTEYHVCRTIGEAKAWIAQD